MTDIYEANGPPFTNSIKHYSGVAANQLDLIHHNHKNTLQWIIWVALTATTQLQFGACNESTKFAARVEQLALIASFPNKTTVNYKQASNNK